MKVLLLEDRPDRQRIFMPNRELDVEVLKKIRGLYMPNGQECKEIIFKINNREFDLQDVELIMIHKSSLTTNGINYLNDFSKKQKTKLIYFSGNNDQLLYNNDNFECLNINSKDFYSINLISFIKKFISGEVQHILEIKDRNWKLSYMLLIQQLIQNMEIEDDEEETKDISIKIKNFKKTLDIENLNDDELKKHIVSEINKIIINI